MKIPPDAIIPRDKLTKYLLVFQPENDKSQFLAQAGFTQDNPDALDTAIRRLLDENEAVQDRKNIYGTFYRVSGALVGPSGTIAVITVWLLTATTDEYRFITLKPNKEQE